MEDVIGNLGSSADDDLSQDLRSAVAQLRAGDASSVPHLRLLFAPTGRIQERSLDEGWGDEFLGLAERFDHAVEKT